MSKFLNKRVRVFDKSKSYEGFVTDHDKKNDLITIRVDEQYVCPPFILTGVIVSTKQVQILTTTRNVSTDEGAYKITDSELN